MYKMDLSDLEEFYHHISIALILVTAFAWNEAFKHLFESIPFLRKRHFLYAVFITILVTILVKILKSVETITAKKLNLKPTLNKKNDVEKRAHDIDNYSSYTYVME